MEPMREEHYKKLIRHAMMESYGPPVAAKEATPCGTLNLDKFSGKMIEIMKAHKLEDRTDWARWYDNLTPSYKKIEIQGNADILTGKPNTDVAITFKTITGPSKKCSITK